LASAAFLAFSRSTSESSAASHESRTYGTGRHQQRAKRGGGG
jgi:hypothetical protein